MFICNIKLSRVKFFKMILAIMAIICISLAGVGVFKIMSSNNEFETLTRRLHAFKWNSLFDWWKLY